MRRKAYIKAGASLGIALLVVGLIIVSSGGSPRTSGQPKGTLEMAVIEPFSGNEAVYGQSTFTLCAAGAASINSAGGVLGHQVKCGPVDTKGDPADAAPAVAQALATSGSSIVLVIGPDTNDSPPLLPMLEAAKLTNFSQSGSDLYDTNRLQYWWRMHAGDSAGGAALAIAAYDAGYRRIAAVFNSDTASQGDAPTAKAVFKALGGQVVASVNLLKGQPSYQSQVSGMLAAHPQAILTEVDQATAVTFLAELQRANSGHVMPLFGNDNTYLAPWQTAVTKAIGLSQIEKYYRVVQQAGFVSRSATALFRHYLLGLPASLSPVPPKALANIPQAAEEFEIVTVAALAMADAHSVVPRDYNKLIPAVLTQKQGAVIVNDFAQGLKALKAGKKIQFVGPDGAESFSQYHALSPPFEVGAVVGSNQQLKVLSQVTNREIASATKAAGLTK